MNTEAPTAAIAKVGAYQDRSAEGRGSQDFRSPSLLKSKAAEKPAEPVKAAADAPAAPAVAPDAKKDTARLPGAEKAAKAEPPKRTGQIAVFVSRKDSKLYVRAELQAAVRRSDHDRAERPAAGHACVHRRGRQERSQPVALVGGLAAGHGAQCGPDRRGRPRRTAPQGGRRSPAEAKPLPAPNSPAEALDRITIAPEAMARIAEVADHRRLDRGVRPGHQPGRKPAKAPTSSFRCARLGLP